MSGKNEGKKTHTGEPTHLEKREFLIEERCARRRVKKIEEGTFRAYADVKICGRNHARLCARGAGCGYVEGGRGVKIQKQAGGDYAA